MHQVGVGALGPVFRTYEPTRDRLVAVKVFRLDITPEQAQALADELAKAAEAGLFHPSIIEPIAAGVEGTAAYRADEYVAAETLDVALRHYAPAPVERILPFITQLAGAIDFARTAGVGHGALHPRDIFVTPEEARAGGFGVVEALERVGIRAPIRRPYTAPERIAAGPWSVAADVFSLGVIAYELITGRRPSGTGSQVASITGGANAAAVHAVIVRAMNEDPARRYPSALAFAADLDAASRGEQAGTSVVVPASAAAAAAASLPDDVEEGAADVPYREDVDERAEPVEAEQEETAFREAEEELDDIVSERDEDEAHFTLTREERRRQEEDADRLAAAGRSLFDEEAVEDLAMEPDIRRGTEQFADEFSLAAGHLDEPVEPRRPAYAAVERSADDLSADDEPERHPVVTPAPLSSYAAEPVAGGEGRGFGIAPFAITTILALLVGFAGGWSVRGRMAAATPASPAQEQPAANAAPQPYSEQSVTPAPVEPPQPTADAPLATRDLPPAAAGGTAAEPAPGKPAAPPARTVGSIEVRSTPSGAGVTLDGSWKGRTPLTIDDLEFGRHTVRIVQPGYSPVNEDVTLSAGRPSREVSVRLRQTPRPAPARTTQKPAEQAPARTESYTGSIYVDSRPRGARVLVDGKFMGTTPIRIPDIRVGSRVVRLQLTDHADWTTSTRVTAGQESRVTGSLERIR